MLRRQAGKAAVMHFVSQLAHGLLCDDPAFALAEGGFRFVEAYPEFREGAGVLALFPKRDGFLHDFIGAAPDARSERGKMGFLVGRETNFHAWKVSIADLGVKAAMFSMR
jgi:hypothetical protein